MKRVYEVFAAKVSSDGWDLPAERVAVVSSKAKAERKIETYRAEHEVGTWWMTYGRTDDRKHIEMHVKAVEVE